MTGELAAALEQVDRSDPMALLRELVDEHQALQIGPLWCELVSAIDMIAQVRLRHGIAPMPNVAVASIDREAHNDLRSALGAVLGSFRKRPGRKHDVMVAEVSPSKYAAWRALLDVPFTPAAAR